MPAAAKVRIRWAAGRDQIAHAHAGPTAPFRTLCELPAIAERDAWQPVLRQCMGCTAIVAEREGRLV